MRVIASVALASSVLAFVACKHSSSPGDTSSGPGVAVTCAAAPEGTMGQLSVWTTGISRKIQPTTAPGTATSVSVETYRDATVSFQVVVRGSAGYVSNVTLALQDDLSDGAGNTLPKEGVTFYRAWYVDMKDVQAIFGTQPVPANSPSGDSRIPDPLIPLVDPYSGAPLGQPFNVDKEENQSIFVDVHVPKGLAAGTYTGSIHVTADGGQSQDVPLSIVVWNLDLPDMRTVMTHFKVTVNDLYKYHKGTSICQGDSCYLDLNQNTRALIKRYEEIAHTHRIDTAQPLVNLPVNQCMVPSSSDWATYDSAMQPYIDGTYWSDGIPSSRIPTPFSPGVDFGPEHDCSSDDYVTLSKAWSTHLKSKMGPEGRWFDKAIVYAYDEPEASNDVQGTLDKINSDSLLFQMGDPEWKPRIMDTVSPKAQTVSLLNPALGIYTVATAWYDNWDAHTPPYYGRKEWSNMLAQGYKLWFYEGNAILPPYATFATNTLDGLEPAMLMWGSWWEQATGFLYWDISNWDDKNPWGPEILFGKTGDGVLIYPGGHDGAASPVGSPDCINLQGPIPSYRLKALRNGLQDWALFHLADTKGLGDMARQQVSKVYGQLGGCDYCPAPAAGFYWKTDEAAMADIRKTIAQAVMAAQ